MTNPLVSVIIPTYNRNVYICDAIDSVLTQTYKNIEVVVVDDGSTDNTRDILFRYGSKINCIFQENAGPSAARNNGIRQSNGELIAFLDSDDVWLPEKLYHQVKLIEQSQNIGLVGCGFYKINTSGEITSDPIIQREYNDQKKFFVELLIRNIISGGTSGSLIRRKCFDKVGLFSEDLWVGEDHDLWIRIAKHYDVKFVEKSLLKIRFHNQHLHSNTKRLEIDSKKIIDRNIDKGHFITRKKAYSHAYLDVAHECIESHDRRKILLNVIKSLAAYPLKVYPQDDKYQMLCKFLLPQRLISFLESQILHRRNHKNIAQN